MKILGNNAHCSSHYFLEPLSQTEHEPATSSWLLYQNDDAFKISDKNQKDKPKTSISNEQKKKTVLTRRRFECLIDSAFLKSHIGKPKQEGHKLRAI
ncbi:hypothetical protein YC2023_044480 [Brassica napus]